MINKLSMIGKSLLKDQARSVRVGVVVGIVLIGLVSVLLWDRHVHIIEKRYGIVVQENGWYTGLERLTDKEAGFRDCHYVLKFEGRKAKYPFAMETRNGYGELTAEHDITPIILDQFRRSDNDVDQSLYEYLWTACQWEFIPNRENDFLLQIKALDKDGKVVYVLNRSKMDTSSEVICTYTDEYGFPITLKKNSPFYIHIVYDKNGRDSVMGFCNEQGQPIYRKDGIYQISRTYLSNGIESARFYHFWSGQLMSLYSSEAGVVHTRFTPDSLRVMETQYVDEELEPTKDYYYEVPQIHYSYDKHGRCIAKSFWDENNQPVNNIWGYHRIVYDYSEKGELICKSYFRPDSTIVYAKEKIYGKQYNICRKHYEYDSQGREIWKRLTCDTCIYIEQQNYTDDGTLTMHESYFVNNKNPQEKLFVNKYYFDTEARQELRIDYEKNYARRVTYDEANNPICVQYFAADNKTPINYNKWHINNQIYRYLGDTTYISDVCYSLENNLTYHHEILVDSLNYTKSELIYSSKGEYIDGIRYTYKKDFKTILSIESINEDWQTIRTYDNDYFYYRMNMVYPFKPSLNPKKWGVYTTNEFGEPSLTYETDDHLAYYAVSLGDSTDSYYNEWGKKIDPHKYEWKYVAYVETKKGISIGFRNADIVLACNDWEMAFQQNPDKAFQNAGWRKEIDRNFIVARRNPKTNEYDTVHVFVPASIKNIDDFVGFHKCRCTYYEREHIEKLLETYIWRYTIRASSNNESSVLASMGIQNEVAILEWNNWNYMTNSTETFYESVKSSENFPKRIVFWNAETDSIGVINTELNDLGLSFKAKSYYARYQKKIDDSYRTWKQQRK